MKELFKRLDGNKTIIGSNLITILVLCPIPEPYKTISIAIVGLFTGIAAKEHFVDKKMLSKDKR